MTKILVTGGSSGLGKFLLEQLEDAVAYDRQLGPAPLANVDFDTIVHCGFPAASQFSDDTAASLQEALTVQTTELLGLSHRQFIFMSSIDVYRSDSPYAEAKQKIEQLVNNQATCPVILRLTALLGDSMRPNNLTRLLFDPQPELSLTPDSSFNWVLYEDVLDFVRRAIAQKICGTYNLASCDNATLNDVARLVEKQPAWGQYQYLTPDIEQSDAATLCPGLHRTSLETLQIFYQNHGD